MAMRKIGQIFIDLGFIDEDQLEMLLAEQQRNRDELLGKIALEMGLISEEQLAQALAEQFDMQFVALNEANITPDVIELVNEPMAELYRVIPVQFKGGTLTVATCDPQNLSIQDEMRTFLGHDIEVVVATENEIQKAFEKYYAADTESLESVVTELTEDAALAAAAETLAIDGPIELASMEAVADSAPVRKLLNMVLLMAIREHASDVHFEPFEDEFRIRIKADGVLYELVPPPRHLAFAITTRIKVMANLDIAERRLPQDGRIELAVGGHPIDLRVSVMPTMFGESVCCRVLDRSVVSLDLGKVGMNDETLAAFREVMYRPNGIILVTGPTGSGKTTTLYSALTELNKIADKIITTEDPVEYDIDGIIQIPVDPDIGNTFANCLRSILRQDPDRILVGEIRDLETAEIAVQASLTGHTVFSTLHTNDAPGTITRLKDMGIPTYMITATVEAILAQRLVRRVCSQCREPVETDESLLAEAGVKLADVEGKQFYRGSGCDGCNNTGYKGRVGLFELMVLNDALREMIMENVSTDVLRDRAREFGMVTLRDAGMDFAADGTTTLEEVVRETILDA